MCLIPCSREAETLVECRARVVITRKRFDRLQSFEMQSKAERY